MPAEEIPPESDVDAVNARLNEGLKTCRSMVADYKALLKGDQETAARSDEMDPAGGAKESESR